jgi:hypothetical protein
MSELIPYGSIRWNEDITTPSQHPLSQHERKLNVFLEVGTISFLFERRSSFSFLPNLQVFKRSIVNVPPENTIEQEILLGELREISRLDSLSISELIESVLLDCEQSMMDHSYKFECRNVSIYVPEKR